MFFTKRSLISFTLAMTLLAWAYPASAQVSLPAVGQTSNFTGLEINPGNAVGDDVYGWVCYGRTSGSINGNFTLMLDYLGMPMPGGRNSIKGGNWTLPVYATSIRGETYMGVLYGNVSGGEIQWDKFGTATYTLNLNITGGSQMLEGLTGQADFTATAYYDGAKTRMKGSVTFYF